MQVDPLQHDEHSVGVAVGTLAVQVVGQHREEAPGDADPALPAALALEQEQLAGGGIHVAQSQPQDLAATQPAEQHRGHHRAVSLCPQRRQQRACLRW